MGFVWDFLQTSSRPVCSHTVLFNLHVTYMSFQPSDTYGLWQVLQVGVFTVANDCTIQALRATLSAKTFL